VCHGERGKLDWNGTVFHVEEIVREISQLNCPFIKGVAFFSCESLKNVRFCSPMVFPVVGFIREIPFDDMIFFASSILNNFRHSKNIVASVNNSKSNNNVSNACIIKV